MIGELPEDAVLRLADGLVQLFDVALIDLVAGPDLMDDVVQSQLGRMQPVGHQGGDRVGAGDGEVAAGNDVFDALYGLETRAWGVQPGVVQERTQG